MALLALATGICACSPSRPKQPLDTPKPVVDRLGNLRHYRLFLPGLDRAPWPLLVYFHGVRSPQFKKIPTLRHYTGSPIEETGLIDFCRANGIALLVPEAFYEYTFLGCLSRGWVIDKELDGVEKMIDQVAAEFDISRPEIYLAGISAGAVFGHFLANHRPEFYAGLISHSQAYIDADHQLLEPSRPGPQFGVLFCYNQDDYPELIDFCTASEKIYHGRGYRTALLGDLRPPGHQWSAINNRRLWRRLKSIARPVQRPGASG